MKAEVDNCSMSLSFKNLTADVEKLAIDVGERAAKTFLQVFMAVYFAGGINLQQGLADASVAKKAALAGLAAVVSLLTSLLSATKTGTASAVAPPAAPGPSA